MKLVYSLPHPADHLESEQAGHIVRARAMLAALESLGHEIIRVEAAADQRTQAAVGTYRRVVKKLLPRPVAMRMRDLARVANSRRYAGRVIEAVTQHRPDLIFETHIAFSLAGKVASEQTGCPLVLDDVSPSWEEEQQYGVGSRRLALDTHHDVTQHARLVIAVSGVIRRSLIEDGVPAQKIVTISNGINEALFHPGIDGRAQRARCGISADAVVIVFVGSFQPYHRVDLLLDAFARVSTSRPAHLLLIGAGKYLAETQAAVTNLGLDNRVTFAGRIPYQDVASYTAAGDIAIMPATNSYGNPMKVYEYMALGKTVLAPDQETITEIVTHGNNAYLFEPGNVESMAVALKTVIEDEDLRVRLGRRAADDARQHTWTKRAETLQQAIRAALAL